jgi:type II secretory pathway predicted ATPase ExeA
MRHGYEAFFGLAERPFSLTPDPTYIFESRGHRRAVSTLTCAVRRGERFILLTGELGVGKTTLCRKLVPEFRAVGPVGVIANPLLTPSGLFRLLLEDFGAASGAAVRDDVNASPNTIRDRLVSFLNAPRSTSAVVIIDEAHTMPVSVVEQLLLLGALEQQRQQPLQLVLIGQPVIGERASVGLRALAEHASTKARLLPIGRDECEPYLAHRLGVAGGDGHVAFTATAVDMIFSLSKGVPRLINLVAERALQEAASQKCRKIGPDSVDAAVASLELLRGAQRRFRWFSRRVS